MTPQDRARTVARCDAAGLSLDMVPWRTLWTRGDLTGDEWEELAIWLDAYDPATVLFVPIDTVPIGLQAAIHRVRLDEIRKIVGEHDHAMRRNDRRAHGPSDAS